MVQGGFYGGFNAHMPIKQGGCFDQGVYLGGVGVGTKEERFSQEPRSKKFGCSVKVEMDESVSEEQASSNKRAKYEQQWSPRTTTTFTQCLSFNPLEEPSPLGLTLKKTPSFLDLIEMKLSQGNWAVRTTTNQEAGRKKDAKSITVQPTTDKLKASNFPASFLKIGSWERMSRYEGDLVAKCYYAKRKLVWEVLEGGLKSKIEIQWSDITSLKASYPENGPGILEIEVSRAPMFCRETNPQPRKHTLWQPTNDFTGGQASICRRHFLQFNQGILEKHFEKLIQCDHRLNLLSKDGIMTKDSPYFDSSTAVFQIQDEQNCYGTVQDHKSHLIPQFDHLKDSYLQPLSSISDAGRVGSLLVPKIESVDSDVRVLEVVPLETPSPSSVMDLCAIEESGTSDTDEWHMNVHAQWEQLRFRTPFNGLQNQGSDSLSSKSMSSLVNQIGSCFSEQKCSQNLLPAGEDTCQANKKILNDIAQHLLSDSLVSVASDEQKVMSRVNSMSSLIQKDIPAAHRFPMNAKSIESSEVGYGLGRPEKEVFQRNDDMTTTVLNRVSRLGSHMNPIEDGHMFCQQSTGMPRQESVGDLLVNIPRIASFPQLFVDCSDELMTRGEQAGEAGWNHFR